MVAPEDVHKSKEATPDERNIIDGMEVEVRRSRGYQISRTSRVPILHIYSLIVPTAADVEVSKEGRKGISVECGQFNLLGIDGSVPKQST